MRSTTMYGCEWMVLLLAVCASSRVTGNILCSSTLDRPEWYEPEYEEVHIRMQITTHTKVVSDGNATIIPGTNITMDTEYGLRFPPPLPTQSTIHLTGTGYNQNLVFNTNGTRMCVGANVYMNGTESCTRQCNRTFGSEWKSVMYYSSDSTDNEAYKFVNVTITKLDKRLATYCYQRHSSPSTASPGTLKLCRSDQHCVITASKNNSTFNFAAMCQPRNVSCDSVKHCRTTHGVNDGVCAFCCKYQHCNDVRNCSSSTGECHVYGPPHIPSSAGLPQCPVRAICGITVLLAWLLVLL